MDRLSQRYREELFRLAKGLTTRTGRTLSDEFQDGIAGSLETRLALYRAGSDLPGREAVGRREPRGGRLARGLHAGLAIRTSVRGYGAVHGTS